MDSRRKDWLVIALLLATAAYALAEEFTLVTYYPSPVGVYQTLRVGSGALPGEPAGRLSGKSIISFDN